MLISKSLLGGISVAIAIVGYIPYFKGMFAGKIRPHAFSWLVWSVLVGIAFAAQVVEKGGAGSWVTGVTALACFTIFVFALWKGERKFSAFDWLALAGASLSMALWWFTKDPALAVILVVLTDVLAFLPTIRKGYLKPHEEGATVFALASLKFVIALFALEAFTFAAWFFPAATAFTNGAFVVMLLVRRKMVPSASRA